MITVKNLTPLPYLVDDDSHLLGGGETGEADENSRHVTQGIAARHLVEVVSKKDTPQIVVDDEVEVKPSYPAKSKAKSSSSVEES